MCHLNMYLALYPPLLCPAPCFVLRYTFNISPGEQWHAAVHHHAIGILCATNDNPGGHDRLEEED